MVVTRGGHSPVNRPDPSGCGSLAHWSEPGPAGCRNSWAGLARRTRPVRITGNRVRNQPGFHVDPAGLAGLQLGSKPDLARRVDPPGQPAGPRVGTSPTSNRPVSMMGQLWVVGPVGLFRTGHGPGQVVRQSVPTSNGNKSSIIDVGS